MSQPNLDPHPANQLGKGTLPPGQEARVLAEGKIFAMRVVPEDKRVPPFLITCRRPIAEAAADFFRDAHEVLEMQRWAVKRAPASTTAALAATA